MAFRNYISGLNLRTLGIGSLFCALTQTLEAAGTFPWWYQRLLSWHMPPWLIQLLEQPFTVLWWLGGFFGCSLLIMLYTSYRLLQEKHRRKKLETDLANLTERYEQLKLTHTQHHALVTSLLAHKITTGFHAAPDLEQNSPKL